MSARKRVAQIVSTLGHPAITLPASAVVALSGTGRTPTGAQLLAPVSVILVALGWSAYRTLSGRWAHIDASGNIERRELNHLLAGVLAIATAIAFLFGASLLLAGFAASLVIIIIAIAIARMAKLSLHVAFAALACFVIAPAGMGALFAMLALTAMLAWSRIFLGRHTYADVSAGLAAGVAAGVVLRLLLTWPTAGLPD